MENLALPLIPTLIVGWVALQAAATTALVGGEHWRWTLGGATLMLLVLGFSTTI